MTFRELIGFTPNMGPFEIAAAWPSVPAAIKSKLPPAVVQSMDAVAFAVNAYKILVTTYSNLKPAIDLFKQGVLTASMPAGASIPAQEAATIAAKIAVGQVVGGLMNSGTLIQLALDQNVPI